MGTGTVRDVLAAIDQISGTTNPSTIDPTTGAITLNDNTGSLTITSSVPSDVAVLGFSGSAITTPTRCQATLRPATASRSPAQPATRRSRSIIPPPAAPPASANDYRPGDRDCRDLLTTIDTLNGNTAKPSSVSSPAPSRWTPVPRTIFRSPAARLDGPRSDSSRQSRRHVLAAAPRSGRRHRQRPDGVHQRKHQRRRGNGLQCGGNAG